MSTERFSFKSDINHDYALLSEVESINPFAFKNQKESWDEIAQILSTSKNMKVTGRSCRERTKLLLKDFRSEEKLSCKLSGVTEEELNGIKLLLTSIIKLEDFKSAKVTELYKKENRLEADKVRSSVLIEMAESDDFIEDIEDPLREETVEDDKTTETQNTEPKSAEQNVAINANAQTPPEKEAPLRKRIRKGDVVSYLEKKNSDEMDFKREELKIRLMEAENRRKELEISSVKLFGELELRKEELELQKELQKEERKEKSAMTQALLSLLTKHGNH